MDTITVIFTGMMIFDIAGQTVYPVNNNKHQFNVKSGLLNKKEVTSVGFTGLAEGDSQFHAFPILKLRDLANDMPLQINTDDHALKAGIPVKFKGEFMGDGDHDVCRLGGKEWPTWTAVRWTVEIATGQAAAIVLNGDLKHPFKLKAGAIVNISNDNPAATESHLPRYSMGVKDLDGKPVKINQCATPVRFHNPITCPPVSLN